MEIIDAKVARFSMLEKDILLVEMKEDAAVDVSEVEENTNITMQLTKGIRYAVLVDARAYASITGEAREVSSDPARNTHVIAQAVIITSLANRLLANFLIQFHRRNKNAEMKLFNDYDTALAWLKEKIKEDEQNATNPKKSKKIPFLSSI